MIKEFKSKKSKDISIQPFEYCPIIEVGEKQFSLTPNLNEIVKAPIKPIDNEEHVLNYLGECITFKIHNEILVAAANIIAAYLEIANVRLESYDIIEIIEDSQLFNVALISNIDSSKIEEFIRLNKYQLVSAIYTEAADVALSKDPEFVTFDQTIMHNIYYRLNAAIQYADNCIMRAIDNIIVYIKTQF